MTKLICRKKGKSIYIAMSGDATLSSAPKIRDFFMTIINSEYSECQVDISGISGIDLSFMELLISFKMSMDGKRKSLGFTDVPNDHLFLQFMTKVGIRRDFFFGRRR